MCFLPAIDLGLVYCFRFQTMLPEGAAFFILEPRSSELRHAVMADASRANFP
jgi:hypothetical protein